MYFKPIKLAVDTDTSDTIITDNPNPVFSWAAEHTEFDREQSAYRIAVKADGRIKWDSGWTESALQYAKYAGEALASGERLCWTLTLRDNKGSESVSAEKSFAVAKMEPWEAKWITAPFDREREAKCFRKVFDVTKPVKKAYLYVCGIGYQDVALNGLPVDDAYLQPAVSNYARQCYYVTLSVEKLLKSGRNCLAAAIGDGWRRNDGKYLSGAHYGVEFFGVPKLTAELAIEYEDGECVQIFTDESWTCGRGGTVSSHLFDGEVYDERMEPEGWKLSTYDGAGFEPAALIQDGTPVMRAQALQPIRAHEAYAPVVKTPVNGGYVFDFGKNIAGIVKVKIPADMPIGRTIRIHYVEEILPDGAPDKETIRDAAAIDTFICGKSGESRIWRPRFTYHGFRYIWVEGWHKIPSEEDFTAIALYTDIKNDSFFRCGSAIVNQIQECVIQTEKDNLYSIATDCPQRDERMGWMNDATVRFEAIPYYFNMGKMFSKIIDDIAVEQSEDGAITCSAPFIYGFRPADPVCSAFLIAALEQYLHHGSKEDIVKHYSRFKAWNECLKAHSENGIVTYSYYGDWASPGDCCVEPIDDPHSAITPAFLMSTGYHYYNYKLLERFAQLMGDKAEEAWNRREAERVQKAFLDKWWNEKEGIVDRGSQGSLAFALWLGILPEGQRTRAAARLHEAVEMVGYRLTTGNLTTRYVMEMLTQYGYVDDAWKIITREQYPSWGFMLQNGATTIWERFELKRGSGMNSHAHPMYGAVGHWLYRDIAGLAPDRDGWKHFVVQPHLPQELMYAEAGVDTPYGMIYIKWQKQFGQTDIMLNVPFGAAAEVRLPWGETAEVGSGYHAFHSVQQ